MTLAPRDWAYALFLWLSLATVLVPALDASGSPLRLTQGSAFSAFTSDVSLGPERGAAPEKDRRVQSAPGGVGGGETVAIASHSPVLLQLSRLVAAAAYPAAPALRPDRFLAHSFGARAPPSP